MLNGAMKAQFDFRLHAFNSLEFPPSSTSRKYQILTKTYKNNKVIENDFKTPCPNGAVQSELSLKSVRHLQTIRAFTLKTRLIFNQPVSSFLCWLLG